jgi:hypothetical protein
MTVFALLSLSCYQIFCKVRHKTINSHLSYAPSVFLTKKIMVGEATKSPIVAQFSGLSFRIHHLIDSFAARKIFGFRENHSIEVENERKT